MAKKKEVGFIKLQIPGGQANPAPPVGPALGAQQVNIMQFCQAFNAETADRPGLILPVEITVYEDRTFSFVIKTPPAAVLLRIAAGIDSGSGEPNKNKVAFVTPEQVREIAETKFQDLNANDIDAACRIIEGTARSMGFVVGDATTLARAQRVADAIARAGKKGRGKAVAVDMAAIEAELDAEDAASAAAAAAVEAE